MAGWGCELSSRYGTERKDVRWSLSLSACLPACPSISLPLSLSLSLSGTERKDVRWSLSVTVCLSLSLWNGEKRRELESLSLSLSL